MARKMIKKPGRKKLPYDMEGAAPEMVTNAQARNRASAVKNSAPVDAFGDGDKPVPHAMDPGVIRELKKRFAPKPQPQENLTDK